jgi:hypothetical protein
MPPAESVKNEPFAAFALYSLPRSMNPCHVDHFWSSVARSVGRPAFAKRSLR